MSTPSSENPATSDPELEVGQLVGEYQVEGKLGQGAFGTVYKATHPLIGKVVAIKVLGRRFSVDDEMVSRFTAEAKAVNQIRHRHIIDIFSFDQLEDGRRYYVMEYLDGEPLDALIERERRLTPSVAIPILRAIAKALDAAHAKGIAHRDLKAENVFLGSDPDGGVWPKLLDFGIAKLMAPEDGLKHKTRTGAPIGTPYYMSPEQCRGRDVDHRTDHYAFGVLAYLMLTGVYPFDGDDYMTILMKQISEPPAPPSTHVPELTPEIDEAVLWLMRKEPAERPPDLRTAARALEQAADRAGLVTAAPTSAWDVQTGPVGKQATQPPNLATAQTTGVPNATAGVGSLPTMAPGQDGAPPRRSRTPLFVGAALAAVALGAGVFALTRGGHSEPTSRPAPIAAPAANLEPPPVVHTPATVPVDAPSAPRTVIATVTGVPDGTEVLVGGASIGAAPGPVQLPYGTTAVVLVFKAEGYLALSKSLVPDHDQDLAVTLKKKAGRGPGTKATNKDDIIDVHFGGKP